MTASPSYELTHPTLSSRSISRASKDSFPGGRAIRVGGTPTNLRLRELSEVEQPERLRLVPEG